MSPTDIYALVDQYIDAYNRKNIDDMFMTVHPLVEFRNISSGVVNQSTDGVAELRTPAHQSLSLFSERHQKIESFELVDSVAAPTSSSKTALSQKSQTPDEPTHAA